MFNVYHRRQDALASWRPEGAREKRKKKGKGPGKQQKRGAVRGWGLPQHTGEVQMLVFISTRLLEFVPPLFNGTKQTNEPNGLLGGARERRSSDEAVVESDDCSKIPQRLTDPNGARVLVPPTARSPPPCSPHISPSFFHDHGLCAGQKATQRSTFNVQRGGSSQRQDKSEVFYVVKVPIHGGCPCFYFRFSIFTSYIVLLASIEA